MFSMRYFEVYPGVEPKARLRRSKSLASERALPPSTHVEAESPTKGEFDAVDGEGGSVAVSSGSPEPSGTFVCIISTRSSLFAMEINERWRNEHY